MKSRVAVVRARLAYFHSIKSASKCRSCGNLRV